MNQQRIYYIKNEKKNFFFFGTSEGKESPNSTKIKKILLEQKIDIKVIIIKKIKIYFFFLN